MREMRAHIEETVSFNSPESCFCTHYKYCKKEDQEMRTLLDETIDEMELNLDTGNHHDSAIKESENSASSLICAGSETKLSCFTLYDVWCDEPEDWGGDEVRLEVITDGVRKKTLKRTMKEGQRWRLGYQFPFGKGVIIKLWDEDWPDPDDLVGRLSIGKESMRGLKYSTKVKRIGIGGADYSIRYGVKNPRR